MRRVIFQEYVTLDGYAAGPNDELDFFDAVADQADEDNLDFLEQVDTMLLGGRTYRLFADYWPTADNEVIAPRLNRMRKVVVSRTLDAAPWGDWEPGEVVRDPIAATRELKAEDGKDVVVWGSISLFHTLFTAGLVDEVYLRVCPIVLGAGKATFPPASQSVQFELVEARPWATGGVVLRYQAA